MSTVTPGGIFTLVSSNSLLNDQFSIVPVERRVPHNNHLVMVEGDYSSTKDSIMATDRDAPIREAPASIIALAVW